MKIVTICGTGVGTSAILKLNAERALAALEIDADVIASDISGVGVAASDAQVILTSSELVVHIGPTNADIIVVSNYFDLEEITAKLDAALG